MKLRPVAIGRLGLALISVLALLDAGLVRKARGAAGAPPVREGIAPTPKPVEGSTLPRLPVVERPVTSPPAVGLAEDTHLDKTPPRQTRGLDLVKMGWTYNCMECHKLFPAKWHYDRPLAEHQNVRLAHGNNRYCLNCHHSTNRNAFVDYDGSEIVQADVVQLCAKCHGPIYRDWLAGVHGRSNGYWDAQHGPRTKLRCIQCHDPHEPKFRPMKPQPPLTYPERAAHPPTTTAGGGRSE